MTSLDREFEFSTRKYFSFLETSYGFALQCANKSQIRYGVRDVSVTIGYDQEHSYELSVELAKAGLRPSFSLGEVLRFAGAPPNVASSFQVTEPNVLGQCVEKLAQALWKYGADLLRNDKNAFIKLTRFRNKESYEYELESRLRHARSLAEDAWQKRDYVAVVSALLPWSHVLSPSEKKRLEYSRKQVPR